MESYSQTFELHEIENHLTSFKESLQHRENIKITMSLNECYGIINKDSERSYIRPLPKKLNTGQGAQIRIDETTQVASNQNPWKLVLSQRNWIWLDKKFKTLPQNENIFDDKWKNSKCYISEDEMQNLVVENKFPKFPKPKRTVRNTRKRKRKNQSYPKNKISAFKANFPVSPISFSMIGINTETKQSMTLKARENCVVWGVDVRDGRKSLQKFEGILTINEHTPIENSFAVECPGFSHGSPRELVQKDNQVLYFTTDSGLFRKNGEFILQITDGGTFHGLDVAGESVYYTKNRKIIRYDEHWDVHNELIDLSTTNCSLTDLAVYHSDSAIAFFTLDNNNIRTTILTPNKPNPGWSVSKQHLLIPTTLNPMDFNQEVKMNNPSGIVVYGTTPCVFVCDTKGQQIIRMEIDFEQLTTTTDPKFHCPCDIVYKSEIYF